MLLGGMASFPIGKSFKFVAIGAVLGVICFGAIFVHNQYKNLTERVTALNTVNSALSGENTNLKTAVNVQRENIRLLHHDIAERDNRLIELAESQNKLEKEIKQQREESDNAIGQFKDLLAHAQCAHQRMPDDIIRLQHQRTDEFNRRYGG
ncbi:hypothetical protein [Xenorhabdus hominickii]|uniref:Cell division protein FtsL n=1 Tax=Xenorhabdus hominickii TaxID=351679 RepID=A0A1V0M4P3_XENHO|nr:hypothetical protein [Xenorhabdus hominickii]ARD69789.1 hypothetical protein [Xenorhabdus hominickii]PHM51577.1 Cell division protein FtsL [Xenorhabdus hominickii]